MAAEASRYRPPSENESGVTLTTPMMRKSALPARGRLATSSLIWPPTVAIEMLARLLLPLALAVALDAQAVHPVDHPHDQRDDEQPNAGARRGRFAVADHDPHHARHGDHDRNPHARGGEDDAPEGARLTPLIGHLDWDSVPLHADPVI